MRRKRNERLKRGLPPQDLESIRWHYQRKRCCVGGIEKDSNRVAVQDETPIAPPPSQRKRVSVDEQPDILQGAFKDDQFLGREDAGLSSIKVIRTAQVLVTSDPNGIDALLRDDGEIHGVAEGHAGLIRA